MDRHRFDANQDPDPNFHFDADPDPYPDWYQYDADPPPNFRPQILHMMENREHIFLLLFTVGNVSLECFSFPSVANLS
jgi:hypothetical protein